MRYHHVGIPTAKAHADESYLEEFKVFASGFDKSPFGAEWLRFEPGCPLPELVQTVPHVAFVVDDLDAAIAGREILIRPNRPSEGVTVAFIVDNGAPVEFLRFDGPEFEVWPGGNCPEAKARLDAGPADAVPGGESSAEAGCDVLDAFAEIRRGMIEKDTAVLAARIAPDYEGCGADGRAHDRSAVLTAYGAGGVSLETFDVSDLRPRVLGDTALVTGLARMTGSSAGSRFEHHARFLDVYVRRDSSWLLVASQTTDVK